MAVKSLCRISNGWHDWSALSDGDVVAPVKFDVSRYRKIMLGVGSVSVAGSTGSKYWVVYSLLDSPDVGDPTHWTRIASVLVDTTTLGGRDTGWVDIPSVCKKPCGCWFGVQPDFNGGAGGATASNHIYVAEC